MRICGGLGQFGVDLLTSCADDRSINSRRIGTNNTRYTQYNNTVGWLEDASFTIQHFILVNEKKIGQRRFGAVLGWSITTLIFVKLDVEIVGFF